jgi:predicted acetyltransferase
MEPTPRTDITWDLRVPATAEEFFAFARPASLAFGEGFSRQEIDDWLKLNERERWLGAFESPSSDLVVGTTAAITERLTVPGGEVGAGAVTAVAVRPDHRRRGALSALMRRQIDDIHAAGEPVAVLWASEAAIYQRFGYGLAAFDGFFEVDTRRTAFRLDGPVEGRVRLVEEQEAAMLIPPVYEAMRRVTPGALSRTRAWWTGGVLADPEYGRRGLSPKFRVVHEVDGAAEGYAIYRLKEEWNERGPASKLELGEAVATTPRSWHALWRFLFDVDLVRTLRGLRIPVPFPVQHMLADSRALGLVVRDGLWLRLVDLPAALSARRYGAAGRLVLEVGDPFCPWNAGRWHLAASGEGGDAVAEVTRSDAEPDLVLETNDLAALYLGGCRPMELAMAGRIQERSAGALARAQAMFSWHRAPWTVMMF